MDRPTDIPDVNEYTCPHNLMSKKSRVRQGALERFKKWDSSHHLTGPENLLDVLH